MGNNRQLKLILLAFLFVLAACSERGALPSATPTIDPDIYNQVPDTTVFEPGQCTAVLNKPTPAYTSNTLGGQPSGEIPAGEYDVGMAADYGSSLWYMLLGAGTADYVKSTSVSSTVGDCSTDKQ